MGEVYFPKALTQKKIIIKFNKGYTNINIQDRCHLFHELQVLAKPLMLQYQEVLGVNN